LAWGFLALLVSGGTGLGGCSSDDASNPTDAGDGPACGLAPGKRLVDLSAEEARGYCECTFAAYKKDLNEDDFRRIACAFSAIGGTLFGSVLDPANAQQECESSYQTCLTKPAEGNLDDLFPPAACENYGPSLKNCGALTIADTDQCTRDTVNTYQNLKDPAYVPALCEAVVTRSKEAEYGESPSCKRLTAECPGYGANVLETDEPSGGSTASGGAP